MCHLKAESINFLMAGLDASQKPEQNKTENASMVVSLV